MKYRHIYFGIIVLITLFFISSSVGNDFIELKGPYFGQKPPGMKPQFLNLPIATGKIRSFGIAFAREGMELFCSVHHREPEIYTIHTYKNIDGTWQERKVASFSGKYSDVDPVVSADGKYLFFASDRPVPGFSDMNLWYVNKLENGWSKPIFAGPEINSKYGEVHGSLSAKNNLYFRSSRPLNGKDYGADLYRAKFENGKFSKAENLGPVINTEYLESDPVVAPDESYLIFGSMRPGGYRSGDLYISFRKKDDSWTKPINMGSEINGKGVDFVPSISPDGKYFFYTGGSVSSKRGVYWVSIKFLEQYKPANLD